MTASKGIRAKAAIPISEMTDGQLADEHRNHSFALKRTKDKLKEIEDELDRRNLVSAQSDVSFVSKQIGDIGLADLKRLRADLGDNIWREYAIPGSREFWRSELRKKDHVA